jgi:hypothetical protein
MARMVVADPSLLSNHLHAKLPEWFAENRADLIAVRAASVVFSEWLASQASYQVELKSNEAFIDRLSAEIVASDEALAVYESYGWRSSLNLDATGSRPTH